MALNFSLSGVCSALDNPAPGESLHSSLVVVSFIKNGLPPQGADLYEPQQSIQSRAAFLQQKITSHSVRGVAVFNAPFCVVQFESAVSAMAEYESLFKDLAPYRVSKRKTLRVHLVPGAHLPFLSTYFHASRDSAPIPLDVDQQIQSYYLNEDPWDSSSFDQWVKEHLFLFPTEKDPGQLINDVTKIDALSFLRFRLEVALDKGVSFGHFQKALQGISTHQVKFTESKPVTERRRRGRSIEVSAGAPVSGMDAFSPRLSCLHSFTG